MKPHSQFLLSGGVLLPSSDVSCLPWSCMWEMHSYVYKRTLHFPWDWPFLFESKNCVPDNFLFTCLLESSDARMSPKERATKGPVPWPFMLSLWAYLFYDVNVYVHIHMQMFLFPYILIIYFTYNSAILFLLTQITQCCKTFVHGKIQINISRWVIIGRVWWGRI